MKTVKASITRIISSIETSLPEGNDVYGFSGINKELLIDGLKETHGLLSALESHKDTFDVLYMKRSISSLSKNCSEYLKSKYKEGPLKDSKFDSFLNDIFSIRRIVKETYLLTISGCIRSEAEISSIHEQLTELSSLLDDYNAYKDTAITAKNTINDIKDNLISLNDKLSDADAQYSNLQSSSEWLYSHIKEMDSNAKSYLSEIETTKGFIVKNKIAYNKSKERLDNLVDSCSYISEQSTSILELNKQINQDFKSQKDYIQSIIDDANRASMAGSFKKRKDELDKPINISSVIMNSSLILIGVISFYLLKLSGFTTNEFDAIGFFSKLPIVTPFIWIAWSNSQRNNYLVRIREDYAFKYASAMAFEGYKKQVQQTSPDRAKVA